MFSRADPLRLAASIVLVLSWLGFGLIAIVGKRGATRAAAKRDMKSHLGFLLQCCAYVVIAIWHRDHFSVLIPNSQAGTEALLVATIAIAAASEWFCFAAARTLGKQWALVARVIPDHQLIQRGPYAVVRNPIYLAMFGNVLATGLGLGTWMAILGALVVFAIGTEIRIRSEEKLLRAAFGSEFENYARRVPALFPRLFPRTV